jgi:hypothetical protein
VVMMGEIDHDLLGADGLQLAGGDPAMIPIETPSSGQRQPRLYGEGGKCPPEHAEPGMALADVVEQGRFHPNVVEPAVAGHLGGLVPVTLVSARL